MLILRTRKNALEGLCRRVNLGFDIERKVSFRNDLLLKISITIVVHDVLDKVFQDSAVVDINGCVGVCN